MNPPTEITTERLLAGIKVLETIIESRPDGDKLEPILDRLYDELEARTGKVDRRARLKALAAA